MIISKRQLQMLVVSTLAGSLFLSGCAKKSYVRQTVDAKVAPIEKNVTDLTAATKDNAERIDAVDKKATQGVADAATARTAAGAAQTTANQANTAAGAAQTAATGAQRTADTANTGVQTANTRIAAVDAKFNTLDRFTAGPVQKVMFKVGSSVLSDEAKATLDGVAGPIASLPSGYRVEIQGFASMDGTEKMNIELSQERAETVQRYLVSKGVALIRMSMLGVGPVGDKKDKKAEREENRRVEVRVFRAAS
jgi:outer membrane protein OmpA-like peptidoglycan-associated protein